MYSITFVMINIYFFQWPSDLGGADTRLKDLIQCFNDSKKYNLHCIPNDEFRLREKDNVDFLKKNNVKILSWNDLPLKATGYAIAFCNFRLFSEKERIMKIKSMGLKFIWSNDMTWTTQEELRCITEKLVDAHIFTSEFHKRILENKSSIIKNFNSFIVPNYFYFENYIKQPKKETLKDKFVVGKLSRADEMKFSENFPLFYDKMPIKNPKFRLMGWKEKLASKFSWFSFDKERWDLLPENKESILEFLSQLDLYVFNAHHTYIENQTRALIEAQLLGIPAIAPNYGNFTNMVWHGRNGFIYNNIEECYKYVKILSQDRSLYEELSNNSLNISKTVWTNSDNQLKHWEFIFNKIAL
jgi:glycosyltransferase involved in cell wall biosynthesis